MTTYAILPVKRLEAAKQRLGGELEAAARRELAEAMVGDVLAALGSVRGLAGVIVVSGEPIALELAQRAGAATVRDELDAGQSAAAALGIERAAELEAGRVLLVPGDCPALDPDEVGGLLDSSSAVTIVPDRHGTGTNALLLALPPAIDPAFGPGSCERHRELAEAAGVAATVVSLPSLALDIDTGSDLRALSATLAGRSDVAPRTHAVLDRLAAAHA